MHRLILQLGHVPADQPAATRRRSRSIRDDRLLWRYPRHAARRRVDARRDAGRQRRARSHDGRALRRHRRATSTGEVLVKAGRPGGAPPLALPPAAADADAEPAAGVRLARPSSSTASQRPTSTMPLQSLSLLNSDFVVEPAPPLRQAGWRREAATSRRPASRRAYPAGARPRSRLARRSPPRSNSSTPSDREYGRPTTPTQARPGSTSARCCWPATSSCTWSDGRSGCDRHAARDRTARESVTRRGVPGALCRLARRPGAGSPAGRRATHAADGRSPRRGCRHARRQGQVGHLPVPARRAEPDGSVRSQAGAATNITASPIPAASWRSHFDKQKGNVLGSPFKFAKHGACGHGAVRAAAAHGGDRRRHHAGPLDEHRIGRSRVGAAADPQRPVSRRACRPGARGSCTAWAPRTANLPAYVVLSDPGGLPVDGDDNWSCRLAAGRLSGHAVPLGHARRCSICRRPPASPPRPGATSSSFSNG